MAFEIPDATQESLNAALATFDQTLRDSPEWQGWETAHEFAIIRQDRYYPIKTIISLATHTDENSFYGGMEAIRYLLRRRFLIAALKPPSDSSQPDRPEDPDWNWGETYTAQVGQTHAPWGLTTHLQLRRRDGSDNIPKATIQRIKNDLIGPEAVAIEFYPESKDAPLADAQRHLWAVPATIFVSNGNTADHQTSYSAARARA